MAMKHPGSAANTDEGIWQAVPREELERGLHLPPLAAPEPQGPPNRKMAVKSRRLSCDDSVLASERGAPWLESAVHCLSEDAHVRGSAAETPQGILNPYTPRLLGEHAGSQVWVGEEEVGD